MNECRILPEPKLFFGNYKSTIDSKVGLMNFGPYGPSSVSPIAVTAGVISTNESLELLRDWLERLSYRIEGRSIPDSNVRGIDFPGLFKGGPLRFEMRIDDAAVETISRHELSNALSSQDRRERISNIFELYKQKFADMSGNHPRPDIILLPIDERTMNECKDRRFEQDKIVFERRTFDKSIENIDVPLFDFHNAIKVVAFRYGMVSQLIRPKTLAFSDELQDPATIAWNFFVAIYYKGTGIPWKLADVDENTCYVGISFFQEISKDQKTMNTSMAHIYLKTGESQIIRGKSFSWDHTEGLSPTLTLEHASYILERVISLYRRQKNKEPRRVVVHKSSGFTEDEKRGFDNATSNIEVVDYVHIARGTDVRAYSEGYDYPAIRGTMFGEKNTWFLFTTGYVPSLGTYPGAAIPMPLQIETVRVDSTSHQICRDIMSLTKLDWNTADFCRREPVTLSVSRKVGSILSEMRNNDIDAPPEGYRYYM
ncbi:MAG: hypothetical protein WBA22_02855 [Candidatus Methanofastidiosia archaeon]